jgi:putative dehydrogenase
VLGSRVQAVGVIGAGAMGMGVVRSLLRNGFATHVRDVRLDAEREAAALGAICHASPASLVAACEIAIIVVVDAAQIDDVLFGAEGASAALPADGIVMLSSTVDPDYVAALAPRVAAAGGVLLDAPISGGPRRAVEGKLTMMISGETAALARCGAVLAAIATKVFTVGTQPGDAAKFKIVNNLMAAVNLAAGAEALALAAKAGLDLSQVVSVVNASSGGSWIFADRMPRALAGDYAPRAAARILAKDVGIAVDFASRYGVAAPLATVARAAFVETVATGFGDEDDAAIVKWSLRNAGLSK